MIGCMSRKINVPGQVVTFALLLGGPDEGKSGRFGISMFFEFFRGHSHCAFKVHLAEAGC